MFFPINTDAPIYYFPWMTIGLIVANIAAFAGMIVMVVNGDADAMLSWQLHHGQGLHPLTWISSAFMHADIFHLLGNMMFLWGFGLVVEGKLGPVKFLAVYLGIAVVSGLIEQVGMLGYSGADPSASLGASGVIFGMMAMALVWAPKNDMTIFGILFYRIFVFEAPIMVFCGLYIVMQILMAALEMFSMGSAVLHLIGAFVGAAVGVLLLKRAIVDCEGWDLFAVMSGNYGGTRRLNEEFQNREEAYALISRGPQRAAAEPAERKVDKVKSSQLDPKARLQRFIADGDFIAASGEFDKLRAFEPMWLPDQATLLALAEGLYKEKDFESAEPLLWDYLKKYSAADATATARVRLKLAKLCLQVKRKPAEALRLLQQVDTAILPPKTTAAHADLVRKAKSLMKS